MRRGLFLVLVAVVASCAGQPEIKEEPVTNTKSQSDKVRETVASHAANRKPKVNVPDANTNAPVIKPPEPSATKRKWSRSGDPIDTAKLDAAVAAADKTLKASPDDEAAKKALGNAYFQRAVALTGARQYASAIGDFRKAVKLDPSNQDARSQITVITRIYESMNIEVPKEGEEPPPLEFKAQKN